MNFKHKIFTLFTISMISATILTGCRDDDLFADANSATEGIDEPSLVFNFNIAPFGDGTEEAGSVSGNHGEDWENFIDPSNLRVIFCDNMGYYLFEADQEYLRILSKDHKWKGSTDKYQIVLPKSYLYLESRGAEHNEAIRKAVEDEGFKVAVLANWPKLMEGERNVDPETGDELVASPTIPVNLQFKWDPTKSPNIPNNHISFLSHCFYDNVYGVYERGEGPYSHLVLQGSTPDCPDGGKMGIFTSWVSYLYKSQKETADFIRRGIDEYGDVIEGHIDFTYDCGFEDDDDSDPEKFWYTPYSYTRTVDEENSYSLENIWRLWNFSYGKACSYHSSCSQPVIDYWEARNKNVLVRELNKLYEDEGPNIGAFEVSNHAGEVLIHSNNPNTTYKPYSDGKKESGYITLPKCNVSLADYTKMGQDCFKDKSTSISKETDYQNYCSEIKKSALQIKAYGEGTLRIRAKGDGKIIVLAKDPFRANTEVVEYVTEREEQGGTSTSSDDPYFVPIARGQEFTKRKEYDEGGEFIIEPNSVEYFEVYIAAVEGEVDIYEVEYMRARQIYDAARNALMPSNMNPIPMYGIQNFDPIGSMRLLPNHTFNMSDKESNPQLSGVYAHPEDTEDLRDTYNYKDVYLLRSLAKVELRFKKSVFKNNMPKHVFMRVMNRSARCEPKDVVNPTDWIWYGSKGLTGAYGPEGWAETFDDGVQDMFVGAYKEMENIMEYYERNPLYDKNHSDVETYLERTSWYYGIWADATSNLKYRWPNPWDWNRKDKVPSFTLPEIKELPYPRIFNTRIDRSDFCRFHQVGTKLYHGEEYIRFIMYVPEKNITDTDSKGTLSANPKVQHIEIRFDKMNDVLNFDDDNCYRIYFTDYNGENGKNIRDEYNRSNPSNQGNTPTFDAFEKDHVNDLQPIMRNCHYIFEINSINYTQVGVNFTVCTPASRNPVFNIQ